MYEVSQILVALADLVYVVSMFTKNKKWLLFLLIVSDVLFGLHFFFLKAFTGAYMLVADIVFLIIAYILNEKYKDKQMYTLGVVFAFVAFVITIFTWVNLTSLFPLLGMAIYFVTMGKNNLFENKIGCGARNFFNIIYMLLISSRLGWILETVLFLSAIIGGIANKKQKERE